MCASQRLRGESWTDMAYCGLGYRAPVHIITGSAGCQEGRDHFLNDEPKWSAFRSQDFGFTKFKAFNGTHIYMEQVSVDLHGQVIDSMWLVKNKTVPFSSI
ncbi:unnamed protein product [Spodoptera exigua]|nr:unnamed protein product [Spodoptera exigua]